jgi:DNA repair exonuclease SbcCD nuclease subunit
MLVIGDPHVEGRQPSFRRDDYPRVILQKIRWCLERARSRRLLPVFLGDIFDKPRDNPNWMLGELIEMMRDSGAIGIYGNHDCAEPSLTENDSLMIMIKSRCLRLVSSENPWVGEIAGRTVLIGGSSYRQRIPDTFVRKLAHQESFFDERPLIIWLTHHDVQVGDYDGGRLAPFEIENVDVVINGHIHTRSEPVRKGQTLWLTPGNISRRSRSDAERNKSVAALEIEVNPPGQTGGAFQYQFAEIPHQEFDEVFHPAVEATNTSDGPSAFVAGLSELLSMQTASGAALQDFLKKNLDQFPQPVADEVRKLAQSVTSSCPN